MGVGLFCEILHCWVHIRFNNVHHDINLKKNHEGVYLFVKYL